MGQALTPYLKEYRGTLIIQKTICESITKARRHRGPGSYSTVVFRSFSCLDCSANHMIPLNLQGINTPVVSHVLECIGFDLYHFANYYEQRIDHTLKMY